MLWRLKPSYMLLLSAPFQDITGFQTEKNGNPHYSGKSWGVDVKALAQIIKVVKVKIKKISKFFNPA